MYNDELDGYAQEQLWYFAYNHKMNYTIGNHDMEKERCLKSNPNMNNTPYSYFIDNNKYFIKDCEYKKHLPIYNQSMKFRHVLDRTLTNIRLIQ